MTDEQIGKILNIIFNKNDVKQILNKLLEKIKKIIIIIGGKIFFDLLAVMNYTIIVGKERRGICRRSIEGDQQLTILKL